MDDGPNIEQLVRRVVAEQFGLGEHRISRATRFDDRGADSLDAMEIVIAIEVALETTAFTEEIQRAGVPATVGDLINLLDRVEGGVAVRLKPRPPSDSGHTAVNWMRIRSGDAARRWSGWRRAVFRAQTKRSGIRAAACRG